MIPQMTKREWPKFAISPQGNRARFDSPRDVPVGWTLEGQSKPLHKPAKEDAKAVATPQAASRSPSEGELNALRQRYFDDYGKKAPLNWTAEDLRKRAGF